MFSANTIRQIQADYLEKMTAIGEMRHTIQTELAMLPQDEQLALQYLYATMPISDIVNYAPAVFLDYVRHGLFLYNTMENCRHMPEEFFLNYILYHRVNTEDISPCRSFFYSKLFPVIQNLKGREAVLAVNYWCAKEASYQSSDLRTASPLTVFSSAKGRCGEESAFTVSALRSVGIPARQVYAPWWAHCDDNHAWVEVWCEDSWQFLGACEPEEVLNRGWFTGTAARAMMVHSRKFGNIESTEVVSDYLGCSTQLNQLARYADTKKLTVSVKDSLNHPLVEAEIRFEVYNYGAFSPIAVKKTDEKGECSIVTGVGTLHLHAFFNHQLGFALVEPSCTECTVVLNQSEDSLQQDWQFAEMIAPSAFGIRGENPTKQQKERREKKLSAVNQKRKEKIDTFSDEVLTQSLSKTLGLSTHTSSLLSKCGANLSEIVAFLSDKSTAKWLEQKEAMLAVLTAKDLLDTKANILLKHLRHACAYQSDFPKDIFDSYLLNPRISLETLSDYTTLPDLFTFNQLDQFKQNPKEIWAFIEQEIKDFPDLEYPALITLPVSCLQSKTGSLQSKKVLFVAVCRSIGIPARIREDNSEIEYYQNEKFVGLKELDYSSLILSGGQTDWIYTSNWSLARLQDSVFETLSFSNQNWENGQLTLSLVPGTYRLMTSTRLTNGTSWVHSKVFAVLKHEVSIIEMMTKKPTIQDLLQSEALPSFELRKENSIISSQELSGNVHVLMWLKTAEEPTEHILNELLDSASFFQKHQRSLVFVLDSEKALSYHTLQKVLSKLPEVQICFDYEQSRSVLARRMYLDPDTFPFILLTDANLNGRYSLCGYNVGTTDRLLQILNLLDENGENA